jgi:glycosyltransferase involved in cell wall biosynthesis
MLLQRQQDANATGAGHSPETVEFLERLLGAGLCRRLGIYRLPENFLLSVVIPVFNEANTIDEIIRRVRACGIPCELVVVDDGSTDGTRERLEKYRDDTDLTLVFHATNQGKGAALKNGFMRAAGHVDVVYGSRFTGGSHRVLYFWHAAGNRIITLLSNVFTNLNLTDIETCYKMFRRELIQQIAPTLKESRFGVEPELTAKVARIPGVRIYERPINYSGRTYAQGKKIGWRDGLRALWCILRY